MKLSGITGTGSGKLGSSVFSVSAGEQIVRQYQPVVTNPSTRAQVDNRAKLKLMSQLSAVMGDVIAIPRQGNLTPRNLFVQANYPKATAMNGVAEVNLASIELTKGGMMIPSVTAERVDGTSIDVALADKADQLVARVVYVEFIRNSQGELQLVDSAIVEDGGANGTFPYVFGYQDRDVIVYAYGIFDKNAKASAKFGNYNVTDGTEVATLIADRKISDADFLLTKTRGIMLAGESHIQVTSVICNQVNIPATGSTSVQYDQSVAVEINAEDVQGKVAALVVDGVLGEKTAFRNDGYAFVGAFELVGGENIRVQIGHMEGDNFVREYTYGGTIVIGQQATAVTSIIVNDRTIASSGATQIAADPEIFIELNSTGTYKKYFRTSVNGVADTPIAIVDGRARTQKYNMNVGDTITFQVGRLVNGTFIEDIAYGGSVVLVEIPAEFLGIIINGTTIAETGSTNVTVQESNNIVVDTEFAISKYLGILNGNNQVLTVHAITGNRTIVQQAYAAGDVIKFAIGTGSSTSSFVAETNFGGSAVFVEAPVEHITNVLVDGNALNDNMQVASGNHSISGQTDLTGFSAQEGMIYSGNTKPEIGQTYNSPTWRQALSNGSFSGSFVANRNTRYWVCIGYYDGESEVGEIIAVYEYYMQCPNS